MNDTTSPKHPPLSHDQAPPGASHAQCGGGHAECFERLRDSIVSWFIDNFGTGSVTVIPPGARLLVHLPPDAMDRPWLPGAMNVDRALDMLATYQQHSKKIMKLHFAFIEGENDGADAIGQMCSAIEARNLICEVNIVRYNPATVAQGLESSEEIIDARVAELRACPVVKAVKIVQRIGYDVKASCGMFVDKAGKA